MTKLVLVVDDDPALCRLVKRQLEYDRACEVVTAGSLDEAWELLVETDLHFDLIVSDLQMPSGNEGFLLAELVRTSMEIPFVVMTGVSLNRLDKPASVDCILHKSISGESLRETCKEVMKMVPVKVNK